MSDAEISSFLLPLGFHTKFNSTAADQTFKIGRTRLLQWNLSSVRLQNPSARAFGSPNCGYSV